MSHPVPNLRDVRLVNFDSTRLVVPVLFCIWMLPFITFSEPDDWRVSRFGTAPIMPPIMFKVMKFCGRGGAIGLMCFNILAVWRHDKRRHVLSVLAPLIAFAGFGMMSTGWSALKTISLQQSATFALLLLLASYIGILWRSDRDTELIIKHLSLAIFALSLVLIGLHFGMPRSGALTKESAGVLHSTNAGAAAGLCILLTLSARFLWQTPWTAWWFPIVATEIALMLIGGNRLSVIVTAIAVLFLMVLALNRGVAAFLVLTVVASAGGYVLVDPSLSAAEDVAKSVGVFAKQGQTTSQISSLSGRAEMWEKMWRSYLKSPVIGHGYFVTTPKGRIYVWHEWGNWTAHNVLLQTLVTTGAVGVSLLLTGFSVLGFGVLTGIRSLKGIEPSVTLLTVLSLWYLGWGFLNSSFIGPLQPESVVFAALLGISAGIASSAHHSWEGHSAPETQLRVAGE